jgi:transposase
MMTNRTYKSGQSREQASFLPPCLENYVGRDNPVRAIDTYVDSLDLNGLGFRAVGSDGGAGQPPYDPADLLRLYLYGYLHQVRSSRRLEREARRNVELMWLLQGLAPGYRTIANFRKDNACGLKAANRDFVLLARRLDLLGGTLVAIDGAFFHGDASKASILTEKRLHEQMAALDRSIAEYSAALDANSLPSRRRGTRPRRQDRRRSRPRARTSCNNLPPCASGGRRPRPIWPSSPTAAMARSRAPTDARLLAKHGQIVASYNVQIAVDDKHKLIPAFARTASEVVNDGNDTGQLHAMAAAAKAALGVEALTVVADTGYYNGETLKACENDAITAAPDRGQRKRRAGSASRTSATMPKPMSIAVRPVPSCGRCTGKSVRPAARWRSAMPVCARFAGSVRCGRAAWPARASGARSNAGWLRT